MEEKYREQIRKTDLYLEEHADAMFALWKKLVETESGNGDKEDCDKVCEIMRSELQAAGAATEVISMEQQGNFLKAVWGDSAGKDPILFCGHMDTVFPHGTLEKNPFRIENGEVHGPGCLDMKGGLTIAVYVLRALREAGYDARTIRGAFPGDEENGHRKSTARDEVMKAAAGCTAAFNFETGYLDDGLVVGRKGSFRASLEVAGIASHSGNAPEKGRSAILEMAHKIIEIQALNDYEHGTSVNVGLIQGGTAVNAVPDSCRIDVDVRFTKTENLGKVRRRLQEIADEVVVDGTKTTLTCSSENPVMEADEKNMGLFEHIRKIAEETGYGPVKPIQVGGWSDASLISLAGVPVVCGLGVKGNYNHSPREFAMADSLLTRAKLIAASVIALG